MLVTGTTTQWTMVNAAGRPRVVYPMRYLTWVSTNAYMFAAMASALRMPERDSLVACVTIVFSVAMGFPLESYTAYSYVWIAAAAMAMAGLAIATYFIAQHIIASVRDLPRADTAVMSMHGVAAVVSYAAFPAIFFAARLCGGDGAGSCLSVADEAYFWRIAEVSSKALVTCIILSAPFITTMAAEPAAAAGKKTIVRALPARFATSSNAGFLSFSRAVREALPIIIGGPALASFAVLALVDTLLSASVVDALTGDVTAAAAVGFIKQYSVVLSVLVALGVFVVALDSAVHRERVRALAASFLPHGFFKERDDEREAGVFPDDFDAAKVYYVDEPHATLIVRLARSNAARAAQPYVNLARHLAPKQFIDVVGFTPAALAMHSADVMLLLGTLFRHFDQLHTEFGATKIETVGDEVRAPSHAVRPRASWALTRPNLSLIHI